MNLTEAEERVLEYFDGQGFDIEEWPFLDPSLEWRPRARVRRIRQGVQSVAAIVVRETCASIKEPHHWEPLLEARRKLPDLAIYFAVPEAQALAPLVSDLHELGIGLYAIKPDGLLARVSNDRVPFDDIVICYPIEPDKPYRNKQNILKVLANCPNVIWWLDRHFTAEGLVFLHEYALHWPQRAPLAEVRVLGSRLVGPAELARLRTDFPAFSAEVAAIGVNAHMRLITDETVLAGIHDRYIISGAVAFNVLPTRSLVRGQKGSLIRDDNPPDFLALWGSAADL